MKFFNVCLMIALLFASAAQAQEVKSEKVSVNLGRVTELHRLSAANAEMQVSLVVHDLGGSTDLSPTQAVYLTVYRKGEMFSTDATFLIERVLYVTSVKARADGLYEILAGGFRGDHFAENVKYVIDARRALKAMGAVTCEDFDCEASENFSSAISVIKK